MERLLTAEEAASVIGFNVKTVRKWCAVGKLPGVNLGTSKDPKWRVRESALNAWIDKRTVKPRLKEFSKVA